MDTPYNSCIYCRRMAPRNCGLVTFLNNNKTRNIAEVARTLAHEVIMMPIMLINGCWSNSDNATSYIISTPSFCHQSLLDTTLQLKIERVNITLHLNLKFAFTVVFPRLDTTLGRTTRKTLLVKPQQVEVSWWRLYCVTIWEI